MITDHFPIEGIWHPDTRANILHKLWEMYDGGMEAITKRILGLVDPKARAAPDYTFQTAMSSGAWQYLRNIYSFSIPSPEALDRLCEMGPILEMACGSGYWSRLVQLHGGDILPYDRYPPGVHEYDPMKHRQDQEGNFYFDMGWEDGQNMNFIREALGVKVPFCTVHKGAEEIISQHPERTLMIGWPPHGNFAAKALREYGGERFIFLGWFSPDIMACKGFFTQLEQEWYLENTVDIPVWTALHDGLYIFKRRKRKLKTLHGDTRFSLQMKVLEAMI